MTSTNIPMTISSVLPPLPSVQPSQTGIHQFYSTFPSYSILSQHIEKGSKDPKIQTTQDSGSGIKRPRSTDNPQQDRPSLKKQMSIDNLLNPNHDESDQDPDAPSEK